MRYFPRPVDLQKSWKKTMSTKWTTNKLKNKTMSDKWVQTNWKTTMLTKWVYKCLYTFIYFNIPSYTPKYLYISLYTPIYIKISNIRKKRSDIRLKLVITRVPGGPHGSEFGMCLSTISPNICLYLKGVNVFWAHKVVGSFV